MHNSGSYTVIVLFHSSPLTPLLVYFIFPRMKYREIKKTNVEGRNYLCCNYEIIFHACSQKQTFHLNVTEYDCIVVTCEMKVMQIFPPVLWLNSIITLL